MTLVRGLVTDIPGTNKEVIVLALRNKVLLHARTKLKSGEEIVKGKSFVHYNLNCLI